MSVPGQHLLAEGRMTKPETREEILRILGDGEEYNSRKIVEILAGEGKVTDIIRVSRILSFDLTNLVDRREHREGRGGFRYHLYRLRGKSI